MDYIYFKLIHLIAVVLFLGNIITGLFWMRIAMKTNDLKIIHHTINGIIASDRYFTIPGVVIITAAGIFAAIYGGFPILKTGWILWSIILFSVAGIAFGIKVAPLQKSLSAITSNPENTTDFDWAKLHAVNRSWEIWGLIAMVTPLAAFVMMTLKVPQ